MGVGVLDAGVALAWLQRRHRAFSRVEGLFEGCRRGGGGLVLSVVNLAEVLIHTADLARDTGCDVVALLRAAGVRLHMPDEAVARRAARLRASLADAFAAATAQELRARLHTTDRELVGQLAGTRFPVTLY